MEVSTKYDLDQKVFFIHENTIKSGIINRIDIILNDGGGKFFKYSIWGIVPIISGHSDLCLEEHSVFSSIDELVKSQMEHFKDSDIESSVE